MKSSMDESKGSANCNETSKLEELAYQYEQRNKELEAHEAEVANHLKILEETIPALKIWYMWRIFNAVGQSVQSSENVNCLLECENISPSDDSNGLVQLMQQLKEFELKLNKDNLKLKDFKEAEKRLRSTIAELENNIKIKNESTIDEFAKSHSENVGFLSKLVTDCKLVSDKIMEAEGTEKSKPQGILIQMDHHKRLDGRKQKDQLGFAVDSSLSEHLTRLQIEVTELQELINQKDVEDKQIESEKRKLIYCRNADEKTGKDEVDSTGDSDLPDRLSQLEREVIDLQELLYQREKEQKRMEAEEEKLCSYLQKCLDHLLSFKNNIQAPLLENLQLQKEKLNKLTKELELQKAEREQDNLIHYKELNELRKQIHKSSEDLKSVISEGSKSEEDSQQNNRIDMQLHRISSNFICSIQYHINNKAKHALENLKVTFPAEELKKESKSYVTEHVTSSSHTASAEREPSAEYALSKDHVASIEHESSTEHVLSKDHAVSIEHEPPVEHVLSKDRAASIDHEPSTEHVLSKDHAASINHEPSSENVLSTDHAASIEHETSTEHVLSKDHAASVDHEPSTEHVTSSSHTASIEHEPSTEHVLSKDRAASFDHEPSTEHVLSKDHAASIEQEPSTEHVLFKDHAASIDHEPSTEHVLSKDHAASIRRSAFDVKTENINDIFEDDEKSAILTGGNSEDMLASLHTEEVNARMEQKEQLHIVTKHESVDSNCNIISLRNKCRVKDHIIKSLADHLKALIMGKHLPINKFYLSVSTDPVKTYDFDRTTLIEYIERNEPSSMAASLMSAPEYSGDNPLQLQVLGKLDSSTVLVSWGPPPANNVSKFQIFVNGELRYHIFSAARNKALLRELSSMEKAVITLCALDNNGKIAGKSTLQL